MNITQTIESYLSVFPDEKERIRKLEEHVSDEGNAILSRSNMRGHITTSMIVLSHDLTHLLLIKHGFYKIWIQPGGHYEEGTLLDSALRELVEETGVSEVAVVENLQTEHGLSPIDIDIHDIPERPVKNEGPHQHYDVAFLAIADENCKLVPQEEEVDGVCWAPLLELLDVPGHLGLIVTKVYNIMILGESKPVPTLP